MDPYAQTELRWPDPAEGPYLLRVTVATVDGRAEPVGIELWGCQPPTDRQWTEWQSTTTAATPLTPAVMRLPLHRIVRTFLDELKTRWVPLVALNATTPQGRAFAESAASMVGHRRGRPPLYDTAHWQAVADTYRSASRAPSKAVADRFMVSGGVARKWVARARGLGLLT